MNPLKSLLLAITLGCSLPSICAAALTWATTTIESNTAPLQKFISVAFPFKNTSTAAVRVLNVQTNCDCLEASADRAVYAPGENGVIVARFAVGDRTGTYERRISVNTDNQSTPQHLRVRITVPELATLSHKVREWAVGAAAAEQSFEVTVNESIRINFTDTLVSANTFRARLETLEAGRHYLVHVAPLSTTEQASAAVRLIGTAQNGERVVVSGYLNVR